ncbi:MAG: radical SAM protein [Elusimicrobia bacterium]|nr:radical SAM protein [Elusimicrobiota bacterium]
MKILLIRPNTDMFFATPPPIGLMYIAAYLKKHSDYEIRILDARVEKLKYKDIEQRIKDYKPDVIGIGALYAEAKDSHFIARISKTLDKNCKVIIGGPYATSDYRNVLEDTNVDFAVIGEGEKTMLELMNRLEYKKDITNVKGIAYRNENNSIRFTGYPEFISDLDSIPFPAWELVNPNNYFNLGWGGRSLANTFQVHKRAVQIFSSRGCPANCIFCHNIFGKRFRARSPENVIQEIKMLVNKYGIREIEFIDDFFHHDIKRAKKTADLIISQNFRIKIGFVTGLIVDNMDEELLDKLIRAGTYRIVYGIESGDSRIQKMIGKNLNLEKTKKIIEMTAEKGISAGGSFMIGFPEETEDNINTTIRYACESRLHVISFFTVTAFPGTALYEGLPEYGKKISIADINYETVSQNVSALSKERLFKLKRIAYTKFYLNPSRLLRIFLTTPFKSLVINGIRVIRFVVFGLKMRAV